ncbi:MAG: LacI family DNA-binding transcriptional regulator [candidate division KSB1 bacterium]|nr:LacI family DNA-binding transcriptional regulator [candidate division KSB1 bacterium]
MKRSHRHITISDIAREAGVSRATVSGVLNNNPAVAYKTRERILKIIAKHNYSPNETARALARQHTGMIGLVVKDISNPLYSSISLGVEAACSKSKYNVVIGNTHTKPEQEVEYLKLLKRRRVDGIIILPLQKESDLEMFHELEQRKLPFVLLGDLEGVQAPLVRADDITGAYNAASHLLKNGYRRLLYLSGPKEFMASDRRRQGFVKAHQDFGMPVDKDQIRVCGWRMQDGYCTGTEYFEQIKSRFDAVFCYNDTIAIGLIRAMLEKGIRIPEEIGVIGFDDSEFGNYITPGLTTVAQPAFDIGYRAAEILIDCIKNDNPPNTETTLLNTTLMIRETCGSYRNNGRKYMAMGCNQELDQT